MWDSERRRFWPDTAERSEFEEGAAASGSEGRRLEAPPPTSRPTEESGGSVEAISERMEATAEEAEQPAAEAEPVGTALSANTCQCCHALVDLIEAAPDWASQDLRAATLEPIQRVVENADPFQEPAAYVRPLLTVVCLRISALNPDHFDLDRGESEELKRLSGKSQEVLREQILPSLIDDLKARLDASTLDDAHPYELLINLRALMVCQQRSIAAAGKSALLEEIVDALHSLARVSTAGLLARQQLRAISYEESVALAFSAAAHVNAPDPQRAYVEAAVRAALEGQDASGQWPLGRTFVVAKDVGAGCPVDIPTHAVAAAVCEACRWLASEQRFGPIGLPEGTVERLLASARYTINSPVGGGGGGEISRVPDFGWGRQEVSGVAVIESGASAAALQAMIELKRLSDGVRNQQTLASLKAIHPARDYWPSYLKWERYRRESEPEAEKGAILEFLNREIVEPRKGTAPWARVEPTSVLLFGPPGTTKTTIVRAVAEGLQWPLVSLSPGDFIDRGLELIEAQASAVFEQLHSLSGAVVLFDECDELFRDRSPIPEQAEMRGIGAFTTASMLPKLQDLYDRGQVVFFVLTNFLRSIDPAIKRSGRIEYQIGVGPPDRAQRIAIIKQKFNVENPNAQHAIDQLAHATERFVRGELILAAKSLADRWKDSQFTGPEQATLAAREIADELRDSLSVTPKMYEEYGADAARYSMAHRAQRAKTKEPAAATGIGQGTTLNESELTVEKEPKTPKKGT